tara:strand:- start:135 stop:653 length:519 start_codon:yes stop_codon:yes gene_type:complete
MGTRHRRTDFHLTLGLRTRAHVHNTLTRASGRRVYSLSQKVPGEGWRVVAHYYSNPVEGPAGPYGMWLSDVRAHVCQGRATAARETGRRTVSAYVEGMLLDVPPGFVTDKLRSDGAFPELPRLRYVNEAPVARFAVTGRDGRRLARDVSSMGRMPAVRLDSGGVSVAGWETD